MMSNPSASAVLEMLIAPLTPEEFFAQYYERKFFHSPIKHPETVELLSLDRIDEIISDSELPRASLSMAKSGQPVALDDYTFANGTIDRGAVLDNFRDGATIILPQLHFADGRLYNFCLALEKQFGARVQTNVYLTPPGAHGFGVHYDNHDVFVIQISGAKEWEIYGDRDGLPFRGEGFRKGVDDTGELKESFVLEAGECLYVPRGTAHRAPNHGDEPSLHITVGILVQTWAEFMLEAVAEASLRIPEMRNSLPRDLFFDAGRAQSDHAAVFRQFVSEIAEKASFDATLTAFSGNFIRAQGPRVRGALLALANGIDMADRLTVRENILFSFEGAEGDRQIVLAGSSIPMSDQLAAQLQPKIAEGSLTKNEFTVDDTEELSDVVDSLVAYGLLVTE